MQFNAFRRWVDEHSSCTPSRPVNIRLDHELGEELPSVLMQWALKRFREIRARAETAPRLAMVVRNGLGFDVIDDKVNLDVPTDSSSARDTPFVLFGLRELLRQRNTRADAALSWMPDGNPTGVRTTNSTAGLVVATRRTSLLISLSAGDRGEKLEAWPTNASYWDEPTVVVLNELLV